MVIKSTITLTVNDKDQTLTVAKDAKITQQVRQEGEKGHHGRRDRWADGPRGGNGCDCHDREEVDGKDVVTTIKVDGLVAKKKKKTK